MHKRDKPESMPIIVEVILCLHIFEAENCTLPSPNYLVPYHYLIQFLLKQHHRLQLKLS